MGYMAGDYYAGDYYAGGLLSGLGSLAKGVFRVAKGFATGGIPGALGGAIGHAVIETHAAPSGPSNLPAMAPQTHSAAIDTFIRRGGRFSAAGKQVLAREHNAAPQPKIAPPLHPALAAHLGLGRRRRMNWANPRAAARAERRIHSLVKHMSKYIRWVHPHKVGSVAPRFGKHKARHK